MLQLKGSSADPLCHALKCVAQGVGLQRDDKLYLFEEVEGTFTLTCDDGKAITNFDEALNKLVEAGPAKPVENKADIAEEIATKLKEANYHLEGSNENACAVVRHFSEMLSKLPKEAPFLGGESLSITDMLCYAALQRFPATAPKPAMATMKEAMGYYAKIAKTDMFKKAPKAEAPQRPLDDVTRFKIVVGKILKVWHHPEADGLYCEEIDIGEAEPRQIATGIRKQYPQDQFENSMVMVLANMKSKPLRGFTSRGMVLCASNTQGGCKPLQVPEGAKPGDLVSFENYPNPLPPDEPLSNKAGQEPIPAIIPHLKTSESGEAMFKEYRWLVNGKPVVCQGYSSCRIS